MAEGPTPILPDWPAPDWVHALSTTRSGGVSQGAFDSLNLGFAAGDEPACVVRNRQLALSASSARPAWLKQIHGTCVAQLTGASASQITADAGWTAVPETMCIVQTADCLPLLVCDTRRRCVAAIHAGWRGLAAGVVEAALTAMSASPDATLIWLGPAIGPNHFEVGRDVVDAFCLQQETDSDLFQRTDPEHWLADLPGLAQRRLQRAGFVQVFSSNLCTFSNPDRFFSYRRDGITGRMASAIAINA